MIKQNFQGKKTGFNPVPSSPLRSSNGATCPPKQTRNRHEETSWSHTAPSTSGWLLILLVCCSTRRAWRKKGRGSLGWEKHPCSAKWRKMLIFEECCDNMIPEFQVTIFVNLRTRFPRKESLEDGTVPVVRVDVHVNNRPRCSLVTKEVQPVHSLQRWLRHSNRASWELHHW